MKIIDIKFPSKKNILQISDRDPLHLKFEHYSKFNFMMMERLKKALDLVDNK